MAQNEKYRSILVQYIPCPHCGYALKYPEDQARHKKSCLELKPYIDVSTRGSPKCLKCPNLKFELAGRLHVHIRIMHLDKVTNLG